MPHSMTGFAAADASVGDIKLAWEVRSVNHRFLDLSIRLPDELRGLERDCRKILESNFRRGKIDSTLKLKIGSADTAGHDIDAEALSKLARLQAAVLPTLPDARPLSVAETLRWPGVLQEPKLSAEDLTDAAVKSLKEAVGALERARRDEGDRIGALLEERNVGILETVDRVVPLLSDSASRYRDKLRERLARLNVEADPTRLEQELALVAQRVDVAEEVDRLRSHVTEIRNTLKLQEPLGRRLDFLIQELNREANTLASKSQDEVLTRHAVDLKVLIEQMREQVQNLE